MGRSSFKFLYEENLELGELTQLLFEIFPIVSSIVSRERRMMDRRVDQSTDN